MYTKMFLKSVFIFLHISFFFHNTKNVVETQIKHTLNIFINQYHICKKVSFTAGEYVILNLRKHSLRFVRF